MYFVFLDVVPDHTIDDISGKITQFELSLRTKHRLAIVLLAHVRFNSICHLFTFARVHQNLQVQQIIIILEDFIFFHLGLLRAILAKLLDLDFPILGGFSLSLGLAVLLQPLLH